MTTTAARGCLAGAFLLAVSMAGWARAADEAKGPPGPAVDTTQCLSCHSVHEPKSPKAQLKLATQSETCFTCHQTIRGKTMRTSHHPIREGRLECTSCHDPHDSTSPKMITAAYVNDKCLECHTEKRG